MYIISACLAGINCRYNGGNNERQWIKELMENNNYILVCPEVMGGLPTPRIPVEIIDEKAVNKKGENLTNKFIKGAEICLIQARKKAEDLGEDIELAILKANSPSCGCGKIYDGTFSGKLIDGDGFFTTLLKENNIKVITELDEIK